MEYMRENTSMSGKIVYPPVLDGYEFVRKLNWDHTQYMIGLVNNTTHDEAWTEWRNVDNATHYAISMRMKELATEINKRHEGLAVLAEIPGYER
jgi:hypothetical protein